MYKQPTLEFFASLSVQVDVPQEVGVSHHGKRRVIPIVGGEVKGRGWSGQILPGGADYQTIVTPRLAELDARYVIESDDGSRIYVQNRAIRVASSDVTQKLVNGESVDPSLIYFRCTPWFETAAPAFEWINERVFVGSGVRRPDAVELTFYSVS